MELINHKNVCHHPTHQQQRRPSTLMNSDFLILVLYDFIVHCCGIKSRLQYPEFQNMIRNHDILCFVETKTDDLDVINFPGFKFIMKTERI